MTVFINIMYVKSKFANGEENDKDTERVILISLICNIIYK